MKTIYSADHRGHAGGVEMMRGELVPMFERPERAETILERVRAVGLGPVVEPAPGDDAAILAVHARDYVDFLATVWEQWRTEGEDAPCALPWVFPGRRGRGRRARSVHARLGWYCFDVGVPFVEGTWRAARTAVDVALTGQRLVAAGERAAFALCRPPGHHATRMHAGGYCYLNNAAIAAQAFRSAGAASVAVLDVDYHHGNGTQTIFYDREDVLFVSLHGHPDSEFPYFWGFADERGRGAGDGFNLNLPLAAGTAWGAYRRALAAACDRIDRFAPDVVVVSLGVDTYREDPISAFRLDSDDYLRMGAAIAALDRPTLFVMEGGYAVDAIGVNAVNVLAGFEQGT